MINIQSISVAPPRRYSIPQSRPSFQPIIPQNTPVRFGNGIAVIVPAFFAFIVGTLVGGCTVGTGSFAYNWYNKPETKEQQVQKLEDQQQEIKKKIDEAKKLEQQQQALQKKIDEIKAP